MPELPEVETIRRQLAPHVEGRTLERLEILEDRSPEALRVPRTVAEDAETAERFLDDALRHGHEGVMVKALDAPYEAGRRGAGWLKVKRAHTLDLVVLTVEWGHGRQQTAAGGDMASRRVVGFSLGEHHNAELAYNALVMAVAARGGKDAIAGVIFHTDQGSEYTAGTVRDVCTRLGITQSMGRPSQIRQPNSPVPAPSRPRQCLAPRPGRGPGCAPMGR